MTLIIKLYIINKYLNSKTLKMHKIIEDYTKFLKAKKGYSKSTISNYTRTLYSFDNFLKLNSIWNKSVFEPEKIEPIDINKFISWNKKNWKKITTTNNYLAWIKMFLIFCKHKWLNVINEENLIFTKEPEDNIESLTSNDIILFINQLKNDTKKSEILRVRDYAIGLVLVYWWLKVQELCNLKVNDLWKNIVISSTWNETRFIELQEEHLKTIMQYITMRKSTWITSKYVFISHSKNSLWKKLSRASVEQIVRNAWEKAWIWKVRPHKLRHTCAAQMLKQEKDASVINQTLWYKNKRTIKRYFNNKISE